ncbi:MAG: SET domain-containing protein [Crocinitomicaceae bacterium]|nr:SET domain-containing protein [Crocinitomicaceae bacterium]
MIHPNTELRFISSEIGYGVVATKFIPAGTITWVLDKLDREFTPLDFQTLEPIYQNILDYYTFRNNKGNFVLCWDNGRFVNHSFNSNCLTTAYDFEIAIRDIQPGEQLTDDYGYLNIPYPFRGIDEGTKRKVVYPDDLLKYYKIWDNKIKKVFNRIPTLDQPLKELVKDDLWKKIEKIVEGKEQMQSILDNYFDGNGHASKHAHTIE